MLRKKNHCSANSSKCHIILSFLYETLGDKFLSKAVKSDQLKQIV